MRRSGCHLAAANACVDDDATRVGHDSRDGARLLLDDGYGSVARSAPFTVG